jgi:hypothetical protein
MWFGIVALILVVIQGAYHRRRFETHGRLISACRRRVETQDRLIDDCAKAIKQTAQALHDHVRS